MKLIQQITADASQETTIILDNGTSILLELRYIDQQQGWFIESLVYKTFTLRGYRVCNSPSMLHQFRNILPFGLACFSDHDREPSLLQDFSSGASKLYLLTSAEVDEYEGYLSGQV